MRGKSPGKEDRHGFVILKFAVGHSDNSRRSKTSLREVSERGVYRRVGSKDPAAILRYQEVTPAAGADPIGHVPPCSRDSAIDVRHPPVAPVREKIRDGEKARVHRIEDLRDVSGVHAQFIDRVGQYTSGLSTASLMPDCASQRPRVQEKGHGKIPYKPGERD